MSLRQFVVARKTTQLVEHCVQRAHYTQSYVETHTYTRVFVHNVEQILRWGYDYKISLGGERSSGTHLYQTYTHTHTHTHTHMSESLRNSTPEYQRWRDDDVFILKITVLLAHFHSGARQESRWNSLPPSPSLLPLVSACMRDEHNNKARECYTVESTRK